MLEFELFWKAFIASALVGTILPLVGTFALLKRSTFLGAGMAHTAFAGVAFGILLGLNPIITALITTAIASTFIWHWTRKGRISHDTGIGIFFSVSMALAVLFFSLSKSQTDALGFLFGAGGFAGMYCGARFQKFISARAIKWILVSCILFTAGKYLMVFFT